MDILQVLILVHLLHTMEVLLMKDLFVCEVRIVLGCVIYNLSSIHSQAQNFVLRLLLVTSLGTFKLCFCVYLAESYMHNNFSAG